MNAETFCFDGSRTCDLDRLPTGAGKYRGRKDEFAPRAANNLKQMEALQEALYADGREGLIILLQALDAAGKDGTVKHVMGGLNPQGVGVHSFKVPTEEDLRHIICGGSTAACPRGAACHLQPQLLRESSGRAVHELFRRTGWLTGC